MSLFKKLFGNRESSQVDPVFGTLHIEVTKDIYGNKQAAQTYFGYINLDEVEVKIMLKDYHLDTIEYQHELYRFIQENFDQIKSKLIPLLRQELERVSEHQFSNFNYDEEMVFQKLVLPVTRELESARWHMQFYHMPTDCFLLVDMLFDKVLEVKRVD